MSGSGSLFGHRPRWESIDGERLLQLALLALADKRSDDRVLVTYLHRQAHQLRKRCPGTARDLTALLAGTPTASLDPLPRGGRCPAGLCESRELVESRTDPHSTRDLTDSARWYCHYCQQPVCMSCQTTPLDQPLAFCDPCGQAEADGRAEAGYL